MIDLEKACICAVNANLVSAHGISSFKRGKAKPWFSWGVLCICGFLLTGCTEREMNVVVFNYWPRALADVYVDGQHVGAGYGAYGPGGTGSKISCCSAIRAGKALEIKWILDGPSSDPMTGKIMQATAELKEIKPGARYLGVYLYPDGSVALDTARGIPEDRLPQRGK